MDKIPNRQNWFADCIVDAHFHLDDLQDRYIKEMLLRTNRIFHYEGLPETIPQKDLELLIQANGYAIITKVKGDLYALYGGLGGGPNAYYLPTVATVANPALKFDKSMIIGKECIVIDNDSLRQGLMPRIKHTAYLLAQCDISFKFSAINIRIPSIVKALNDTSARSAEEFFKQVEQGDKLGSIFDYDVDEQMTITNYGGNASNVPDLIEMKQYIIATFYEDIGLQSQFNMKREALNSAETSLNDDILYPLIDDMLERRKIAVDAINAMYGTSISVDLDSVWKQLREQEKKALDEDKDDDPDDLPPNKEESADDTKGSV